MTSFSRDSRDDIVRRPAERQAWCRGCDKAIKIGEEMVTTYSWHNRGQNIHFCLECAKTIGDLATAD